MRPVSYVSHTQARYGSCDYSFDSPLGLSAKVQLPRARSVHVDHTLLRFLHAHKCTTQLSFGFRNDALGITIRGKRRDTNAVPVLIVLLLLIQKKERIIWAYLSYHSFTCDLRLCSQITTIYHDTRWKLRLRGEQYSGCRYDFWHDGRA
jgi:hypothetical protein